MSGYAKIFGKGFRNVLTLTVLGLLIVGSTLAITNLGSEKGMAIPFAIIGLAVGIYSVLNYTFGFYAATTLGFFVFFIGRFFMDRFPVGYWVDLLILTTFLGLLLNKILKKEPFFTKSGHIITQVYLLYTLFLLVEAFNPSMHSFEGWFFVFRKFIQFLMVYFIALNIFDSVAKVKFFFSYWVALSFIAGLYGCYQEWFGFLPFEMNWIMSTAGRKGLYMLVSGMSRKFSTFSDPAAYGIILAATFVLTVILLLFSKSIKIKLLYLIAGVFIVLGVAYSGTRTAYFIIVAALFLYILMTITNRNTLIFACFFLMGFIFIMFGPIYGNATINRIRSTFEFSEEASMKVRDVNRALIQPYIYSHPIGGGLATSGVQGLEYNPNHFLAGFPPDSGFVKTAVETGWIGLFLQCLIYFLILQSGVHAFYNTKNQELRVLCIAAVSCAFAFIIGQYGQVAIGQFPGSFLFFSCLALIAKARHLDKPNN